MFCLIPKPVLTWVTWVDREMNSRGRHTYALSGGRVPFEIGPTCSLLCSFIPAQRRVLTVIRCAVSVTSPVIADKTRAWRRFNSEWNLGRFTAGAEPDDRGTDSRPMTGVIHLLGYRLGIDVRKSLCVVRRRA